MFKEGNRSRCHLSGKNKHFDGFSLSCAKFQSLFSAAGQNNLVLVRHRMQLNKNMDLSRTFSIVYPLEDTYITEQTEKMLKNLVTVVWCFYADKSVMKCETDKNQIFFIISEWEASFT